jgi:hypothetical protein
MALTVPIVGDVLLLRYMLNFQAPADVQMRLYNNNITPHESSALSDFTESTAASPYTAVTLTGASWTVSSGATAGSTGTYAQQSFNFSTADTIYGYFITSGGARTLLWAERFTGGPFQLPSSGGTIAVTPKISLD